MSEYPRIKLPLNQIAEKRIMKYGPDMWQTWELFANNSYLYHKGVDGPMTLDEYINASLPEDVDHRDVRLYLFCEGMVRLKNEGSLRSLANEMGMSWHEAILEFRKTEIMLLNNVINKGKQAAGDALGVPVHDKTAVEVLILLARRLEQLLPSQE